MSTISDVAKRAGVSTMTVSRVINNFGYISQDTRERVERAIVDLGYVPNALARSLRFKQTKTIALIVTDITNSFFTTIARGVEDTASEQGFSVMFCNTDESQTKEAEYVNVLLQKQVDGILLVPACSADDSVSLLQDRGTPVVVLDRRIPNVQVDTVRCDTSLGSYQLTQHLLGLGHRRIALLSGPRTVSTAVDRADGYRRALTEAGLAEDTALEFYGPFTQAGGYQIATEALALNPRPSALVAANNFIAIGAMQALREAGLRLPDDLSMVTFDDFSSALVMEPFLTAIDQPAYEMGRRATELLLTRLAGGGSDEPQEILMPTRMIIRTSSGPVPVTNT
ncbi:MAG TPA: LacI family DNA-binding transcriptional regulator [Aggregatilineales bacterium]|nr:LacI family DNA-binding transcriptional regulator [Aggregatilineales bacterium]